MVADVWTASDTWTAVAAVGGLVAALASLWAAFQSKGAAQAARDSAVLQRAAWEEEQAERRRADLVCYLPVSEAGGLFPFGRPELVVVNQGQAAATDVIVKIPAGSPATFRAVVGDNSVRTTLLRIPAIPHGDQHEEALSWLDDADRNQLHDLTVDITWSDREAAAKRDTQHVTLHS